MSQARAAIVTVTPFAQNCTLLWCDATERAVVVDPGGDLPRIRQAISETGVTVEKIWLTHGHIDHAGGAAELKEILGVPIEGPHRTDLFLLEGLEATGRSFGIAGARNVTTDRWLDEGDRLQVGDLLFDVLHCPGALAGKRGLFQCRAAFRRRGRRAFSRVGRPNRPSGRQPAAAHCIDQGQAAAAGRRRSVHLRTWADQHHRPRAGDEPVSSVTGQFPGAFRRAGSEIPLATLGQSFVSPGASAARDKTR